MLKIFRFLQFALALIILFMLIFYPNKLHISGIKLWLVGIGIIVMGISALITKEIPLSLFRIQLIFYLIFVNIIFHDISFPKFEISDLTVNIIALISFLIVQLINGQFIEIN